MCRNPRRRADRFACRAIPGPIAKPLVFGTVIGYIAGSVFIVPRSRNLSPPKTMPIPLNKLPRPRSGIKLRQLHNFLAVLETGSLRRAAEALNITEPALSKSIRNLEKLLGVPLLDRGPRGMRPTAYGELLAVHASTACNELDQAI